MQSMPPTPDGPARATRILVAEDSPTQAQRLLHILRRHGYEADAVADGREALHRASEDPPALIISDVIMPELDGYDLTRALKASPALREIPVILVTTLSDPQDVIRGLECGADSFVLKPYDEQYLVGRVRYVLTNRELRRASDGGMGVEIFFNGQRHYITADRLQILNLLLSTYEAAVRRNEELSESQAALQRKTVELDCARREAEEASRAKSAFLAAMSHEIRTPMNGVIGMLDVLQQSSLMSHQMEMVELIRESAFSLLGVIEDILDFSKIEAGKLEIESAPMSVADVVEKACGLLASLAAKKAVDLRVSVDPAIPDPVLGDALRVRQVLINLVGNAIKFSSGQDRPGSVSVRAGIVGRSRSRVTLELRVADNGIGMDEQTQARLFTSFTQADASTTRRFGGTGLGLAISSHLMTLMGGRIDVNSAPGQGSTFVATLPCEPAPAGVAVAGRAARAPTAAPTPAPVAAPTPAPHPHTQAPTRPASPPGAPPRELARQQGRLVLVAEDNETNQKVAAHQFGLLGVAADIVGDGRAALERWRSGDYALVVTDLHMPVMDGYQLTAAIRGEEGGEAGEEAGDAPGGGRRTPIVALSANTIKDEAERCLALGMDGYLAKPVQLAVLRAMLDRWLPPAANAAGIPDGLAASPQRPPVDVSALIALVGDDPAVIDEFLDDFGAAAQLAAGQIRAACGDGDVLAAAAAAHKLKASARSVGALALGDLCEQMERHGNAGRADALAGLLPAFDAEIASVGGYLAARVR